MAFETPTNPRAAKAEAEELRREAHKLLSRANRLDPPEKSVEQPAVEEESEVETSEESQEPEASESEEEEADEVSEPEEEPAEEESKE